MILDCMKVNDLQISKWWEEENSNYMSKLINCLKEQENGLFEVETNDVMKTQLHLNIL